MKQLTKMIGSLTAKFAALLLAFTCAGTAWGATLTVPGDYATIPDAFTAASAGDTIQLTADMNWDGPKTLTKSLVFDLNGKTLTFTVSDNHVNGGSTVEFRNGNMVFAASSSGDTLLGIGSYSPGGNTLVLTDVKVTIDGVRTGFAAFYAYDSTDDKVNIANFTNCEIVYKNDTATTGGAFKGNTKGGTFNFNNTKVTISGNAASTAVGNAVINVSNGSEFVIKDNPDANGINNCALTVTDSTLTIENNGGRGITARLNAPCNFTGNSVVTITGNGEGDIVLNKYGTGPVIIEEGVTLTAAVVGTNASSIIQDANGNAIALTNGGLVVTPPAPVAQIGETKYKTLAEAIAAVGAGDVVIELLDDATLDYNAREAYGTVGTTKLTIKGNGKTLTLNQKDSDWSSLGLKNAEATLAFEDMTINKTGYGCSADDAWNTHAIKITSKSTMTNVTVNHAIDVENDATLTNVTINESGDFYALWITGDGQTVTVSNSALNAPAGRGVKIADQYVKTPESVTLNISDTTIKSAKKAAVLVSSTAGAAITAANVNITNVAADSSNIAWVDEDWSANFDKVTVNGGQAYPEGGPSSYATAVVVNGKVVGYYETIDAAINVANATAGDVTIEVYKKCDYTDASPSLGGTCSSIAFVGKTDTAEISITRNGRNGYISGTGSAPAVTFTDLKLTKPAGGFADDAGFMNVAFSVYRVASVSYENCTFPNGACAAGSETTYKNCTFYMSHDGYELWAYGAPCTVDGCTFAANDKGKAIKMYAENSAKTTELTVKNSDFSAVDNNKPAIVLSYGKSVTLEGNTYSKKGVFELDKDKDPDGTTVTADIADIACNNDDYTDCGVLVDGKIYTTLTSANEAGAIKSDSTVTLFYSPMLEGVELPEGVTLITNGYALKPVAKVGTTPYGTIGEAVAAWGPGKTLTLLANVEYDKTVTVEVNATKSTQNWTLDLGDYTWTANGCNAFQLYAAGGSVMSQNYGLKVYANENGGITATGKYCIECKYDTSTAGYRPRLEIHGGTYTGSYIIYYASLTWQNTSISNGPSTHFFKGNDVKDPVFNGNFALAKCPITINAGVFNGTSFSTYPVNDTAKTNLQGGHFKTMSAFPNPNNNKGIVYGNYRILLNADGSIDVTNGAPAAFEASTPDYAAILTRYRMYNGTSSSYYPGSIYFASANHALQNTSTSLKTIVLNNNVVATQDKTVSSGTFTIDATAEGAAYNGTVTISGTSGKFVLQGNGDYTVTSGLSSHYVKKVTDGSTSTYSLIEEPAARIDDYYYKTLDEAVAAYQKGDTIYVINYNESMTAPEGWLFKAVGDDMTLVMAVAQIGDDGAKFGTVAEAVAAAQPGDTVKLLVDESEDAVVKISKDVTIDLNGKTVTLHGFKVTDGNVEFKNGKVVGSTKASSTFQLDGGNVTLTGLEVVSLRHAVRIEGASVVIDGGSYSVPGTTGTTTHAINIGGGSTLLSTLLIKDGTFIGPKGTDSDSGAALNVQNNSKVTVEGGLFKGGKNNTVSVKTNVDNLSIAISGGYFDQPVNAANCADDYQPKSETVQIDNVPYYTVEAKGAAKDENGVYYATLSDAVTSTTSGDTITLLKDVTENISSFSRGSSENTKVLKLNGFTVTGQISVDWQGILDVDGGKVEYPSGTAVTLQSSGTMVMASGEVTGKVGISTVGGSKVTISGGKVSGVNNALVLHADVALASVSGGEFINTTGTTVINGWQESYNTSEGLALLREEHRWLFTDNIVAKDENDVVYAMLENALTASTSGSQITLLADVTETVTYGKGKTLRLGGKTITGGLTVTSTGILDMSDGKIVNPNGRAVAVNNGGRVIFSGGEITGSSVGLHTEAGATIKITGGTITGMGTSALSLNNSTKGSISGGNYVSTTENTAFNNNYRKYLAEGYVAQVASSTETATTVKVFLAVASVGGQYFETLAAAIAAATADVPVATISIVNKVVADEQYATLDFATLGAVWAFAGNADEGYTLAPAVASISGTPTKYFATLAEAFAAAADGDTIKLLKSSAGNGIQVLPGRFATDGLTVDFGGFTYTVDGDLTGSAGTQTQAFQLQKNNKITFTSSAEAKGVIYSAKAKMLINNYCDLTLDKMTLTLDNPDYAYGYTLSDNNGNVVINDTTINANPAGAVAFDVCRGGGSGAGDTTTYPSVHVTVTGNSVINGDVELDAKSGLAAQGFGLTLEGGTMNGEIKFTTNGASALENEPEKVVVAKKSTFEQAPPTGYLWSEADANGVQTLAKGAATVTHGETVTTYATLAAAFAAAADGDTVTLLKDVSLTDRLFVNAGATPAFSSNGRYATTSENKSIELDLNGKNITSSSNIALAGGSLNIKGNGTITTTGSGLAPIEIYGRGDLEKKRMLTIGSGVTLNSTNSSYGLNVFGSNSDAKNLIDVTVDGTVNGTIFVLGNLKNAENKINIVVNGKVIAPAGEDDNVNVGIALNGNANVTVNNDATVSGDSGIEVRAGTLTVNGGTIKATASEYTYKANNSGSTTKGAAIVVAQHTTVLGTAVTLNGGKLEGIKTIGVTDVNGNMDKVSVLATQGYTEGSSIPEDYKWVESDTEGMYKLVKKDYVAQISETKYETFAAALDAVKDGETITVLDVAGNESGTEIDFDRKSDIAFKITGTAPNYRPPIITFADKDGSGGKITVTIEDAMLAFDELDARQNATINVVDSNIVGSGGNSILKSYFNGAINVSGTSKVYMMQVTTTGYITISDNAEVTATWQANVLCNGLLTVAPGAKLNTAALQLTGDAYLGRDNTDADRVGKPAALVVDGATLNVGWNAYSSDGADYNYNSSGYGINIGTVDGKSAVLDIKNASTVVLAQNSGNGEYDKKVTFGAGATVNVTGGSTLTVRDRGSNGVTLTNGGKIALDVTSSVATPGFASTSGSIAIDSTGLTQPVKVIDYTGAGTMAIADYGTVTVTSGETYAEANDLWVKRLDVAQIGTTKYASLAEAILAAQDGDTIEILDGTWGADAVGVFDEPGKYTNAQAVRAKSLTIQAAEGAKPKFTADVKLGYEDSNTANATMTVKGLAFENAKLSLVNYVQATVEDCTFTGSGANAALFVGDSCDKKHLTSGDYPADQVTIKDCTFDGTAAGAAAIRVRNGGNVTVTGNTVANSAHNGILLESNTAFDNTAVKTVTITGNTITEWNADNVAEGGRGIRASLGGLAEGSTVTVEGNVFRKTTTGLDKPDFAKVTGAGGAAVDISGNDWNNMLLSEVKDNDAVYTSDAATTTITSVITTRKEPVAQIGTTKYETLQDANAASQSGDTIELLKDVEIEDRIVLKSGVTLDGKNKTISPANSPHFTPDAYHDGYNMFEVSEGVTGVTIKNVTITSYNSAEKREMAPRHLIAVSGQATVQDVTLHQYTVGFVKNASSGKRGADALQTNGDCTIAGALSVAVGTEVWSPISLNNSSAANKVRFADGATLTITEDLRPEPQQATIRTHGFTTTEVIGADKIGYVAVFGAAKGTTCNQSGYEPADSTKVGNTTRPGTLYNYKATVGADEAYYTTFALAATVVDTTGTVENFKAPAGDDVYALTLANTPLKVIKNGFEPNLTVPKGYELLVTTAEGGVTTYTIGEGVATITTGEGDTAVTRYYASLQSAVDNAANGETVVLLKNIDLANQVKVGSGKTVTIDLAGKTVSNTADIWNDATGIKAWSLISVQGGTLTLKDSSEDGTGKLDAKENDCYALDVRGGSLTVESGTYVGNISAVYVYDGALAITGGKFDIKQLESGEGNDRYRFLVNCLDANYGSGTATVAITGGTFHNFDPADNKAEVAETRFTSAGYVGGTADENGFIPVIEGYIVQFFDEDGTTRLAKYEIAKSATVAFSGTEPTKATTTEYTYQFAGWTADNGTTVSKTLPAATADVSYKAVFTPVANVASITRDGNTTYYTTLKAANTASQSGDTIMLLKDVEIQMTIALESGVTLNGDGHTISPGGEAFKPGLVDGSARQLVTINRAESNAVLENVTLTSFSNQWNADVVTSHLIAIGGSGTVRNVTLRQFSTRTTGADAINTNGKATFEGTLTVSMGPGIWSAISLNNNSDANVVTFAEGANIVVKDDQRTKPQALVRTYGWTAPKVVGAENIEFVPVYGNAVGETDELSGYESATSPKVGSTTESGTVSGTVYNYKANVGESAAYFTTFNLAATTAGTTGTVENFNAPADDDVYALTLVPANTPLKVIKNGFEPNLTIPEGYELLATTAEGVTTYTLGEGVATITTGGVTRYYASLQNAVDAAVAGDMVKLLVDTTIKSITVDKKIILDLNEKTVSSDGVDLFYVTSNGDLTIAGNGKVNGPTNGENFDGKALISVDGGKLTIENGTFTATGSGSDGMYGVYVYNSGTATFGKADGTGPTIASHFAAIGTNNTTAPVHITVNGGTYTANAAPTNNEWWSYFCAPVYAAAAGDFTLNGGTFNGYYGISSRYANVDQDVMIDGDVVFFASSLTQVFVDEQTGSAGISAREIFSNTNKPSVPAGWTWVATEADENVFKLTKQYMVTFVAADGITVIGEPVPFAEGTAAEDVRAAAPAVVPPAGYTLGWTPQFEVVVSNTTYTATYTLGAEFIYTVGEGGVKIDRDWIDEVLGEGLVTDGTVPGSAEYTAAITALSTPADNGIPWWQNYVLGLTGAEGETLKIWGAAPETVEKTGAPTGNYVIFGELKAPDGWKASHVKIGTKNAKSGYTVNANYRLAARNADGTFSVLENATSVPVVTTVVDENEEDEEGNPIIRKVANSAPELLVPMGSAANKSLAVVIQITVDSTTTNP